MMTPVSERPFDMRRWLSGLLLLMLPLMVSAQSVVGTVQFVHGEAMALDPEGEDRILSRGDEIREGEVLVTGPDGAMQLQLNDGGLLALRANTEMSVDEYQYDDAEDDRSLFSVARGVFRKISGAIGQNEPANVQMQTPVATIGIRGTDFEGGFLAADNDDPAGAYLRVNSGRAWLGNEAGELDLTPGQAGFVASTHQMPQLLEKTPGLFRVAMPTGPAEGDTGEDEGPLRDSDTLREHTRAGDEEVLVRLNRSDNDPPLVFDDPDDALATLEVIEDWTTLFSDADYFRLVETGHVVAVNAVRDWSVTDEGGLYYQVWGTDMTESLEFTALTLLTDFGAETLYYTGDILGPEGIEFIGEAEDEFVVTWGRWNAGDYIVEDERDLIPGFMDGELHYMLTDAVTPLQTVAARSGTGEFAYGGGSSVLVNDAGTVLDSNANANGVINIDFDAGTMDYTLFLSFISFQADYELNSEEGASIGEFLAEGIVLNGECTAGSGCVGGGLAVEGIAGGNFAGPNAEALLSFFQAMDENERELWGTALFGEDFVLPN